MNIYKEVAEELKKLGLVNNIYRFQGGNSFEYFDIKKNRFCNEHENRFVYFSTTLDHHLYFTIRRLKQLINQLILLNTPYEVCKKQLNDTESFSKIINMIHNSDKTNNVFSINLIYDANLITLFKENYCYPNEKNVHNTIERVDRRVYNGGYGISGEWLELLEIMNFFTAYYKINSKKIIQLIHNMKKSRKINSIQNAVFLLDEYNYKVNSLIFDDFIKYEIMNLLECIIDKNLCRPNSQLYTNPTESIKKIVTEYQQKREKTLTLIDKKYNSFIQ